MAEDGSVMETPEMISGENTGDARTATNEVALTPTVSGGGKGTSRRRMSVVRPSLDADEFMTLLHGSDPVKLELNRLENEVRDKDRELSEAQAEIKALRLSERLREKAVEELTDELTRVDEKLKLTESLLESKNLEIKKINDEKKASMAAQFAAEATLRRVHAAQKDDDMPPIEAILAPLEAELKLARHETAKLQDDNKALDRLTKSKEAALLDAERTVQSALAKASMVDDLQNKNQELMKQIEICQEERKTLDRELARAKVTANRVATVVANEWKDANDKVMPVKQWLEERRILQGEMQQLRDKLAITERTAKSEALLKDKYQLRLKVLEETLRPSSTSSRNTTDGRSSSNGPSRRQSLGGAESISKLTSNGFLPKRSPSFQLRSSGSSTILKHAKGTSKSFDGGSRSLDRGKKLLNVTGPNFNSSKSVDGAKDNETESTSWKSNQDEKRTDLPVTETEDTVPGLLYDLLQKEVVALRKAGHEKDQSLKDKDDAIELPQQLKKAAPKEGQQVLCLRKALNTSSYALKNDLSEDFGC
uniref:Myosin heavy chain, clone n=1 Tax=Solanum tuberosum TaxID=4113 RepID=M1BYW6_SOLTU